MLTNDHQNDHKLFNITMQKDVCPLRRRLLCNIYTQPIMKVKWNDTCSNLFPLLKSVKEGEMIGPILFTIYISIVFQKD